MNKYSIGQIEDLHEFLNYCVKEGFLDEDTAQDYIERQDWVNVERLRDMGDSQDYDANKPEEAGSEASDFII